MAKAALYSISKNINEKEKALVNYITLIQQLDLIMTQATTQKDCNNALISIFLLVL